MADRRARPPRDPRGAAPTMRQRWAALAGQQQAMLVLATLAVILMFAILIVVLASLSDDDNGDVVADASTTATPTETASVAADTPVSTEAPTTTRAPEPTATLAPQPTATVAPTATLEPTPSPVPPTATLEPTPEPSPTAVPSTPIPSPPTATLPPQPVTGEVQVEDRENDVFTAQGQPPPEPIPLADLRAVELELNPETFTVRFRAGVDIPTQVENGAIVHWSYMIWIEGEAIYRYNIWFANDQWTVTIVVFETGAEHLFSPDSITNGDQFEIIIPSQFYGSLTAPFNWAAWVEFQTADGQVFGDNLPDAGDVFVEMPAEEQRLPFPP